MDTGPAGQAAFPRKSVGSPSPALPGEHVHHGPHICQLYTDNAERLGAVIDYIKAGIQSGDQTFCIAEKPTDAILSEFLADWGVSLLDLKDSGHLHLGVNRDFYLKDGAFDADRVLGQWETICRTGMAKGFQRTMVVADVLPDLCYLQGGTQLILYESRLDEWMRYRQATIICQYDARVFDGSTILGVLRVHPLVLVNGRVLASPFFVAPDRSHSH